MSLLRSAFNFRQRQRQAEERREARRRAAAAKAVTDRDAAALLGLIDGSVTRKVRPLFLLLLATLVLALVALPATLAVGCEQVAASGGGGGGLVPWALLVAAPMAPATVCALLALLVAAAHAPRVVAAHRRRPPTCASATLPALLYRSRVLHCAALGPAAAGWGASAMLWALRLQATTSGGGGGGGGGSLLAWAGSSSSSYSALAAPAVVGTACLAAAVVAQGHTGERNLFCLLLCPVLAQLALLTLRADGVFTAPLAPVLAPLLIVGGLVTIVLAVVGALSTCQNDPLQTRASWCMLLFAVLPLTFLLLWLPLRVSGLFPGSYLWGVAALYCAVLLGLLPTFLFTARCTAHDRPVSYGARHLYAPVRRKLDAVTVLSAVPFLLSLLVALPITLSLALDGLWPVPLSTALAPCLVAAAVIACLLLALLLLWADTARLWSTSGQRTNIMLARALEAAELDLPAAAAPPVAGAALSAWLCALRYSNGGALSSYTACMLPLWAACFLCFWVSVIMPRFSAPAVLLGLLCLPVAQSALLAARFDQRITWHPLLLLLPLLLFLVPGFCVWLLCAVRYVLKGTEHQLRTAVTCALTALAGGGLVLLLLLRVASVLPPWFTFVRLLIAYTALLPTAVGTFAILAASPTNYKVSSDSLRKQAVVASTAAAALSAPCLLLLLPLLLALTHGGIVRPRVVAWAAAFPPLLCGAFLLLCCALLALHLALTHRERRARGDRNAPARLRNALLACRLPHAAALALTLVGVCAPLWACLLQNGVATALTFLPCWLCLAGVLLLLAAWATRRELSILTALLLLVAAQSLLLLLWANGTFPHTAPVLALCLLPLVLAFAAAAIAGLFFYTCSLRTSWVGSIGTIATALYVAGLLAALLWLALALCVLTNVVPLASPPTALPVAVATPFWTSLLLLAVGAFVETRPPRHRQATGAL